MLNGTPVSTCQCRGASGGAAHERRSDCPPNAGPTPVLVLDEHTVRVIAELLSAQAKANHRAAHQTAAAGEGSEDSIRAAEQLDMIAVGYDCASRLVLSLVEPALKSAEVKPAETVNA